MSVRGAFAGVLAVAAGMCATAAAQDVAPPAQPLDRLPSVTARSSDHRDPLSVLVEAARAGDAAAADELLRAAYQAAPGARTRTDVFAEAAKAAAAGGAIEQALAWSEWGVSEAARTSPDRHADALSAAVEVGAKVGARRAALDHARAYASVRAHIEDRPTARGAHIPFLDVSCPDLVGDLYVRRSIDATPPPPGAVFREPAACAYVGLPAAAMDDLVIRASRSWQEVRDVAQAAAAGRFSWFENANPDYVQGIRPRRTLVDLASDDALGPIWTVAADYSRRGRPRVTRVYAITSRDGVLVIASGALTDAAWPPDIMLAEAVAALQSVRGGWRSTPPTTPPR